MMDRESSSHRHSHLIIILISVLIGILMATLACRLPQEKSGSSAALAQDLGELEDAFVKVADKTVPAVVSIKVEESGIIPGGPDMKEIEEFFRRWFPRRDVPDRDEDEEAVPRRQQEFRRRGMGSGWIYSEDGYIVTNAHVVVGASKVMVALHDNDADDEEVPATVVGTDPKTELAVIKVDAGRKLPTLSFGDSDRARVGSWVMAVGAPYSWEQTVTVGVVSAKGRYLPTARFGGVGDVIQTDAAINPGNSGGPLVNLRGEVIGINVAYFAPSNLAGSAGIGFAIPSNVAKRVISELIEHKKVARGWLGVTIKDLSHNLREYYGVDDGGVLVVRVEADAPAADSELQADDVVIAMEGKPTPDTWALQKAVGDTVPGATVKLTVIRDRKEMEVSVKLGEMPDKYAGRAAPEAEAEPAEEAALGLTVADITRSMAEKNRLSRGSGVVVNNVAGDSPALGEVRAGDVILKVNREEVKTVADYKRAIEQAEKDNAKFIVLHLERRVEDDITVDVVDVPTNW